MTSALDDHFDLSLQMMNAIKEHHEDGLLLALHQGADPLMRNSVALKAAIENGFTKGVKILIPKNPPLTSDSHALHYAMKLGQADIVQLILSASPHHKDTWDIAWSLLVRDNSHRTDTLEALIESPIFEFCSCLETLSYCVNMNRFDFFKTLLESSEKQNKLLDDSDMSISAFLIRLARLELKSSYGENASEPQFFNLFFEAATKKLDPLEMNKRLRNIKESIPPPNKNSLGLERQSSEWSWVEILESKWEQWQLEQSVPMPASQTLSPAKRHSL